MGHGWGCGIMPPATEECILWSASAGAAAFIVLSERLRVGITWPTAQPHRTHRLQPASKKAAVSIFTEQCTAATIDGALGLGVGE